MRRITIVVICLLITFGCQPISTSAVEPIFQTNCVSVESGFLNFENININGNIISILDTTSIVVINSSGKQVYSIKDLADNILQRGGYIYIDRGWFTNIWLDRETVIYEMVLYASDSTLLKAVGELNFRSKNYRTIYATRELPWTIVGLFDDKHLLLKDNKRIDKLNLVLLNITTSNLESFTPSFSNIYSEIFWGEESVSRILNQVRWYEHQFSPDKSRAFLFVSNSSGMKYILWDNKRERIIWEKPALSPIDAQWSPMSNRIAYIDDDDLIILNKNGKESRLLLPSGKYLPITLLKWSPNGQMLAFWIGDLSRKNEIMQPFEFVVYDTKTNAIINTCIISEGTTGKFFWSPDGRFILIAEKSHEYLLLDLQEKRAFRFNFEQGEIIGWMK